MTKQLKVGIVGATGETGTSIVNGLLEAPEQFDVTALIRPASLEKKQTLALKERGVKIVSADITKGDVDEIAKLLSGINVVISTLLPYASQEQYTLASAAKVAGVERFIPSWWGPPLPPRGAVDMRAEKENVLDHVKRLHLGYTAIDIGWWYQLSVPRLPSGKTDAGTPLDITILGEGSVPIALTDVDDIGTFVARIIADPRTLNKLVFAWSEVWTQQDIWNLVEKESGEKISRKTKSSNQLLEDEKAAKEALAKNPDDYTTIFALVSAQYGYSWGVKGYNTPEYAKYLGYLDARELYPDIKPIPFKDFVHNLIHGSVRNVYQNRFPGKK